MIGILGKKGPPDEAVARRALAAVPYPTPDTVLRRVGNALVGIATRPDFVDERISAPGDIVAAMTGRIDNAAELHAELTKEGHPPRSAGDADIVVAALRAHGPEVVNRFRGAFAGVATDGRTLWGFRDHVGFRVLFLRDDANAMVAAGEARQVVVAAGIPEEPDLRVLEWMMYGGLPSDAPAAIKGAERLAQGATVTYTPGQPPRVERYWKPWTLFETSRIGVDEAVERFRYLMRQAVERSLTGKDVVSLSGGLDSPTVAAYAAPAHLARTGRPIGALSAVFPDLPDVDESALIALSAARYGMELHTYRPSARALDDVEAWSRRFGTPVLTLSIPEVWEAYTRARSLGYENVLTGEFAELTFGKFPHMLPHMLLKGRIGPLLRMIASEHRRGASRSALVRDALTAFVPGRVANWWFLRKGQGKEAIVPSWMDRSRFDLDEPRPDFVPGPSERYRSLNLWGFEGCTVTMEADVTCAAMAGVTIRRPFADVDLWEFFITLQPEVKFPELQWKALARRALRGVVPDEILDKRKKTYFDPHVMQQVDYPALRRLLVRPKLRLPAIDYAELQRRLEREDLSLSDWLTVRELARVHAFLNAY